MEAGAGYTQVAVDGVLGGFGSPFVAISLFLFAFTTLVAYFYIAETNLFYIVRGESRKLDYKAQRKQGLDPVFRPSKVNIKNADYWVEREQEDEKRRKTI